MSGTDDDEALTWEGDERLAGPGRAPRLVDDRPAEPGRSASGGSFALLALGVLGGVALIETAFWVRSAFELQISSALSTGTGTPGEIAAFAVNVAGRVLAVAAPVLWYVAVLRLVAAPSKRLSWLLLGAVLLVPWPAVLGAA